MEFVLILNCIWQRCCVCPCLCLEGALSGRLLLGVWSSYACLALLSSCDASAEKDSGVGW